MTLVKRRGIACTRECGRGIAPAIGGRWFTDYAWIVHTIARAVRGVGVGQVAGTGRRGRRAGKAPGSTDASGSADYSIVVRTVVRPWMSMILRPCHDSHRGDARTTRARRLTIDTSVVVGVIVWGLLVVPVLLTV